MLNINKRFAVIGLAALALLGTFLFLKSRLSYEVDYKPEIVFMPFGVSPTGSQIKTLMKMDAEYSPKGRELRTALNELYTPQQREAQKNALRGR